MPVHGYFDDSATLDQQGLICLAGFVTNDHGWERLADEWRTILARHSLQRLHTSDFLSGGGEYRAMRFSQDRRNEVLREFILVVRRHVRLAVAVGVDVPAYRAVLANIQKKFPATEFCCYRLIKRTIEAVREWEPQALPLAIAFDDSKESMRFHSALRFLKNKRGDVRDAVAAFSFVDDRFVPPVQAADMLACLTAREFRKGEDVAWRKAPFKELFLPEAPQTGIAGISELWDEQHLRAAAAEMLGADA